MGSILLVLQLIVAIFLVVVILMQRSNGGALSGLGGDNGVGSILSMEVKTSSILDKTSAAQTQQTPAEEENQATAEKSQSEPEVPVAE